MNETLTPERKRLFMQKWDSRPEKPDNMQWTVFVITLVIIAAVMVYGLLM